MQSDQRQQQGIATIIQWTHGGDEVYVEGSWDNWLNRLEFHNGMLLCSVSVNCL